MTIKSLVLAAGLVAAATSVQAQSVHLCTGIGLDGREEAAAFPHTLKLVYAMPQGSYLGNVAIRIPLAEISFRAFVWRANSRSRIEHGSACFF